MIERTFQAVGSTFCVLGGIALCFAAVGFLVWMASCIWIAFSNRFRAICQAESLIFEYRKHRTEFLEWREHNCHEYKDR